MIGQLTIEPGQVLALGYGSNTPEGFLGRVDAVTLLPGGQASLQTEPATLEEAGAHGELDLASFRLVGAPGSLDPAIGRRAFAASIGSSAFNPDVSKAIKCQDGASASLTGNISVGVTPVLHASFSLIHGLTRADFSLTGSASASLTAQAEASAGCKLPQTALLKDPLHIATFAGDIGPIPVVVSLQGQLFIDANIAGKAHVSSDINASASITGGIRYKKGAPHGGFSPIFNGPNASFRFDPPSVAASGVAQADVEPALQMLLYGVVGPQLGVKAGLALTADTTKNPWWKLTAPVSIDGSLTADVLGHHFDSGTLTLYQHTFDVADAGGPFSGAASVTVSNPGSQTSSIGTPVNLRIQATDSDGGSLTYSASGLPAGLAINRTTGLITGTPSSTGTTSVAVTANDSTGPSGSAIFSWTVVSGAALSGSAISAGSDHTCALTTGGVVACWGSDQFGQLGSGSTASSSTPSPVDSINGATHIVAGGNDSCAVLAANVECWGWNSLGQLGDGSGGTAYSDQSDTPQNVTPAISDATAISASTELTCALLSGGSVDCWGSNQVGQLGDGQTASQQQFSNVAVGVANISGASAIATSRYHGCALVPDGMIDCWGDNRDSSVSGAAPVSGFSNVTAIAAGYADVCGLDGSGAVYCGDPSATSGFPVAQVSGLPEAATAIAVGDSFACAILASKKINCWGLPYVGVNNSHGQLGNGTTADSTSPVPVTGISNAVAIAAGGDHACALLSDSTAKCWGENAEGELGNGTTADSDVPVTVLPGS